MNIAVSVFNTVNVIRYGISLSLNVLNIPMPVSAAINVLFIQPLHAPANKLALFYTQFNIMTVLTINTISNTNYTICFNLMVITNQQLTRYEHEIGFMSRFLLYHKQNKTNLLPPFSPLISIRELRGNLSMTSGLVISCERRFKCPFWNCDN